MTLPPGHEPDWRPPATTTYRPRLGMWLLYAFFGLIGVFLVFVAFYENRTPRVRLVAILGAAGMELLLADLGLGRVQLDQQSVRIRGLFANAEFTYHEVKSPPETLGDFPQKPILLQRLSDGRVVKFPIWLGAPERREIVGKIEAHRKKLLHDSAPSGQGIDQGPSA